MIAMTLVKPTGDEPREALLAECARKDADQRDPKLHHRQEPGRLARKAQRIARGAAAHRLCALQARVPAGHHRQLRHREDGVEHQQADQDDEG
jgi:hypothetical protein